MNIQRFTMTGFDQDTRCAEAMSDENGAWVLYDEVKDYVEQYKKIRELIKNNQEL